MHVQVKTSERLRSTMMAHLLSLDDAKHLPVAQAIISRKGPHLRYVMDHLIRHYKIRTLQDFCNDLGRQVPEIYLRGGIGALIMTPSTTRFFPMPTTATTPASTDPAMLQHRMQACTACDRWSGQACAAVSCSCSGLGRSGLASSQCPLGRW